MTKTWTLSEADLELVCGGRQLVVGGEKQGENQSDGSSFDSAGYGDMQQNPDPDDPTTIAG